MARSVNIKGKGLKSRLQHHLANEKLSHSRHERAVQEKQRKEDKAQLIKGKPKKQQKGKKAYIPFNREDTLLLVGEGDFSFARSLVEQNLINPEKLIASSYDSKDDLIAKYASAQENLDLLEQNGVALYHSIDATNMVEAFQIKKARKLPKLNHIMFNFPHTGRGMKDMDRNIRDHQILVLGFYKSASELLKECSSELEADMYLLEPPHQSILLSVFEGEPYVLWGIKALARDVGWKVERSGRFDWEAFPGYHHRRTNSMRDTTKPAQEREARIYCFVRNPPRSE